MDHGTTQHAPTVDLRVRDLTPLDVHDWQDEVISRLQAFKDAGTIREYSVSVWGRSMSTSPDEDSIVAATDALETVHEFEAWAANNGHSLKPGFRRRELTSLVSETTREVIEVPILCLAIYIDDALQAVYPSSASETVYTVADGLDALEAGQIRRPRKIQSV